MSAPNVFALLLLHLPIVNQQKQIWAGTNALAYFVPFSVTQKVLTFLLSSTNGLCYKKLTIANDDCKLCHELGNESRVISSTPAVINDTVRVVNYAPKEH